MSLSSHGRSDRIIRVRPRADFQSFRVHDDRIRCTNRSSSFIPVRRCALGSFSPEELLTITWSLLAVSRFPRRSIDRGRTTRRTKYLRLHGAPISQCRASRCRRRGIFPIRDLEKRAAYSRGRGLFSERGWPLGLVWAASADNRIFTRAENILRHYNRPVHVHASVHRIFHGQSISTLPRGDFRQRWNADVSIRTAGFMQKMG